MSHLRGKIVLFLSVFFLNVLLFCAEGLSDQKDILLARPTQKFTDDLPAIQKRRFIRILVSYSKTNYFVSGGNHQGFEYELMQEYGKFLNKNVSKKEFETTFVFIPIPFDELLDALVDGKGDIAAAGLTITEDRQRKVAFTNPYLPNVDEVIVASKQVKNLLKLEDLSGKAVYVVRGSSYIQHLEALNEQFRKKGLSPIKITLASSTLEAEDILEMVNAGFIDLTVVDHHIAEIWSQALKDMIVRKDLKVNAGGQLAWAVRKNNPKLLAHLNEFVKNNKKGTLMGNILFKRYYADTKWIKNPISAEERKKLDRYIGFFKKYSDMYGFDWLAIAAQAYQESRLDQNLKSPAGAIGLMQLLPSTAEYVGIKNIQDPENNIHAGVKYMHYLREKFFNDPGIEPGPKFDFTLAAYNAGPNRVKQLREQAKKMGLDENKWFFNVERAALDKVGQEPVRYVGNINKYYIAFSLIVDQLEKKEKEKKSLAKR